jgi:hypothetical protein
MYGRGRGTVSRTIGNLTLQVKDDEGRSLIAQNEAPTGPPPIYPVSRRRSTALSSSSLFTHPPSISPSPTLSPSHYPMQPLDLPPKPLEATKSIDTLIVSSCCYLTL